MLALRWLIVGLCCAVPIGWALALLIMEPATLCEAWPTGGRGEVLLRTLGVNGTAALIAVGIATLVFPTMHRRVGIVAAAVALAMPGLAWAYAGAEFLRWVGPFAPQSWPDVARGIVSLGLWLWPVPAVLMSVAHARTDRAVLDAAALDGGRWRVSARLLLPAAIAGGAAAFALATGTFAVWDASGIRVTSTVVRTVFDTGTFVEGVAVGQSSGNARAASAIATLLPTVLATLIAAGLAVLWGRVTSTEVTEPEPGRGRWRWPIVVGLALFPVTVLMCNLPTLVFDPRPYLAALFHGVGVAVVVGLVSACLGVTALVSRGTGALVLAVGAFLLGGQWLAIAWIRLLNQPIPGPLLALTDWIYGGDAVVVLAHSGRFAWIGLAAAWLAWTPGMRALQAQAGVDGATPWQTLRHVTLPLHATTLIAAAAGAAALSLGEIQATVLLVPDTLPPRMATWLHIADDRAMTEASVVLAVSVGMLALIAGGIHSLPRRRT